MSAPDAAASDGEGVSRDEFELPGDPDGFQRLWTPHRLAYVRGEETSVEQPPGCPFCTRLERALGADGTRATWRNIWEDDEAREFVAMVNDGNEVVPTVVIDGRPHTNPDPALVKKALVG